MPSTTVWAETNAFGIAADAETVLCTVTLNPLPLSSPVLLQGAILGGAFDTDTTAAPLRVRRAAVDGVQVGPTYTWDVNGGVFSAAGILFCWGQDSPGNPASTVYVLTVALTDANTPSTGISAVFAATYNLP